RRFTCAPVSGALSICGSHQGTLNESLPVLLKIEDDPDRHDRALVFVNGWQVGRYINDIGPQHVFPIPAGVLDPHCHNTLAIAVWSTGEKGGIGHVSLISQGNLLSPMSALPNAAPVYDKESYTR
ncbi:MAG: beta galactosidase jelly roll domain-containing protein, partial [Pseudomonadota bacterium]|nr:beta galactosidase jelly roll domain-containing protein [Pseudomonadota bacterium]